MMYRICEWAASILMQALRYQEQPFHRYIVKINISSSLGWKDHYTNRAT